MFAQFSGIGIKKMAACLPSKAVPTYEYAPNLIDEKLAKRFAKNTGFSQLRIAPKAVTTSDLCLHAAKCLLGGDISPVDIDVLIFVTQTPDWSIPATSHWLQHQLRLKADCICIDVNEGCAGFEHGYYLACTLLKAGNCKNVLLLAGDTISKVTNPEDRATRLIFGDAGTASIIGEMPCDSVFSIKSYGDRYNAIITENSRHRLSEGNKEGYLFLDGSGIMEFTLNEVYENIKEFIERLHMSVDEIKLFACHQANKLILSSLAEQLGVAGDKVPFVAGNIGNTSSASIPLLLCGDAEYKMKNVMLCGFGVGLSCDLCLTDLSQTEFVGVVDYE